MRYCCCKWQARRTVTKCISLRSVLDPIHTLITDTNVTGSHTTLLFQTSEIEVLMADYGMRSLSEESGNNINHVHVETLCDSLVDFLDALDDSEISNQDLVGKRLSESEAAILECGLVVADIKSISEDIDSSFVAKLEHDKAELTKLLENLERVCDKILPQIDTDLRAIEELVDALEVRHREYRRDQTVGWFKSFLPSGSVKQRTDHAKYAHQLSMCRLQPVEAYLQHFEDIATSDVGSTVTGSSGTPESPNSTLLKAVADYEVL
jgi:hypothetical protein